MKGRAVMQFMKAIRSAELEEYLRGVLFCFGAPTIRGLKAATLLNLRRGPDEDARAVWDAHCREWLCPLGVEWLLLNEDAVNGGNDLGNSCAKRNALVLIYRRDILECALADDGGEGVLASLGYPVPDVSGCLECLKARYKIAFPHEIGIFLGYPPDDVRRFMECPMSECIMSGYWKVYGDVCKARSAVRRFRRAERDAARLLLMSLRQNGSKSPCPTGR